MELETLRLFVTAIRQASGLGPGGPDASLDEVVERVRELRQLARCSSCGLEGGSHKFSCSFVKAGLTPRGTTQLVRGEET